jgi:hypothetical protein
MDMDSVIGIVWEFTLEMSYLYLGLFSWEDQSIEQRINVFMLARIFFFILSVKQ